VPGGQSGTLAPGAPSSVAPVVASLEEILPHLVRKVAWSGDARRGAVRLELGAGRLAGAALLVQADGGRVEVTLDTQGMVGGEEAAAEAWRDRIASRLRDQGVDANVEVR
jgi:hypothetical protein